MYSEGVLYNTFYLMVIPHDFFRIITFQHFFVYKFAKPCKTNIHAKSRLLKEFVFNLYNAF